MIGSPEASITKFRFDVRSSLTLFCFRPDVHYFVFWSPDVQETLISFFFGYFFSSSNHSRSNDNSSYVDIA